jgi:DNA repair exonuclease SbcCD ATPase subunit
MKFKSLKAYNTYSFPSLDFRFNYRGTTLIIGRSEDENTANGSGKTTLIKVLYLGLWGKELYDATLDEVKSRNADNGWLIEIEFEDSGHTYKIVRYRDRKDKDPKSGVEFYSDGKLYPADSASEMQKGIEAKLKMSPKLFKSSVLTAQGEDKHFLTVSDTDKKEIFSELLDLTVYSAAFNVVKKEIDDLEDKINEIEGKIESASNRIKERSDEVANLMTEEDKFEDSKLTNITNFNNRKKNIEKEIAQLRLSNLESSSLLDKEKELNELLDKKNQEKDSIIKDLEGEEKQSDSYLELSNSLSKVKAEGEGIAQQKKNAESDLDKLNKRKQNPSELDKKVTDLKNDSAVVESLVPSLTSHQSEVEKLTKSARLVCGLFDTDTEAKIEELKTKITKLASDRDEKVKKFKEVQSRLNEAKVKVDEFKAKRTKFNFLDREIAVINNELNLVLSKKKKIGNIEPDIEAKNQLIADIELQIEAEGKKSNPFKALIDLANRKIEDLKQVLERDKKTISIHEDEMIYYNFWKAAFSPLGIRSFIFDEVIDLLNQKVQDNLNELFDGALSVVFESESKNNKGAVSNKISTKYYMRGKDTTFQLLSGGEKRRAILAVNLALTEIAESYSGTVMNIKFLDEPFEGIDSQGQIQCFKLFARLAQNKDGFFVISHDPSFQQLCPNVIYVLKKNEASRIVTREEFDPIGDLNNLSLMNDN